MEVMGIFGELSLVELIIIGFIAVNIALSGAFVLQRSAKRLTTRDQ